jgi:hypothetical protein
VYLGYLAPRYPAPVAHLLPLSVLNHRLSSLEITGDPLPRVRAAGSSVHVNWASHCPIPHTGICLILCFVSYFLIIVASLPLPSFPRSPTSSS